MRKILLFCLITMLCFTNVIFSGCERNHHSINNTEFEEQNYSTNTVRTELEDGYSIIKYTEKGNKVTENVFNDNDTLDAIREYDENGHLVHELGYVFGDLIIEWEYDYNDEGNKIRARRYNSNKTLVETTEYDENENAIRQTTHYPNSYVTVHKYNENGNRVRSIMYYSDENDSVHQITEYDEYGKEKIITTYYPDGDVASVVRF